MDARSLLFRRFFDTDSTDATPAISVEHTCVDAPEVSGAIDSHDAEEVAFITRAQAGDQEAFAVLGAGRNQRQVYNLALRMLRDTDEASEAAQEAFLAAWQHLRGFRQDARFATWLYRITYHHCLKVCESCCRDSVARLELSATTARMHSPEGRMSAESALVAETELRETVRDEIALLPPKYRSVLVLRHLQELSYEEISDVMRMPIGTVKTQLFRARALLKERLEDLDRARSEGIARAGELRAELEAGLRTMLERHIDYARKGDGK